MQHYPELSSWVELSAIAFFGERGIDELMITDDLQSAGWILVLDIVVRFCSELCTKPLFVAFTAAVFGHQWDLRLTSANCAEPFTRCSVLARPQQHGHRSAA